MSLPPDPLLVAALALLGLALLVSMSGVLRHAHQHRAALLVLQLLAAAGLAAALLASSRLPSGALHVVTAGADAAAVAAAAGDDPVVVLPGGDANDQQLRVPDLATALRAHPDASRLVLHGHGLDRADRETASGFPVQFQGVPPEGIVALAHPLRVRPGEIWELLAQLRFANLAGLVIQLRDPSGRLLDEAPVDAEGRARLSASVPVEGRHGLSLEARRGEELLAAAPVQLAAAAPPAARGLLLAAAPSPEIRALRRWAEDAGVNLEARLRLAPGLALGTASARLDAETLANLDLVIVDERSLMQLSAADRDALFAAVRDGLGLLLRLGAPPSDALRELLAGFGVRIEGEPDSTDEVWLSPPWQQPDDRRPLHAWALDDAAPGAAVLLNTRDGGELGWWRAVGQGRIGTLALLDSHRLATRGDARAFADLWAMVWATLARPVAETIPMTATRPAAGQPMSVCGGSGPLAAIDPQGKRVELSRDATAGDCARWLPSHVGWHLLEAGEGAVAAAFEVHVAPPAALAGVLAQESYRLTSAMVAAGSGREATDTSPFLQAWLRPWLLGLALLAWLASALVERQLRRSRGSARQR